METFAVTPNGHPENLPGTRHENPT